MADPVIKLESIRRTFEIGGRPFHALADISLEINSGEFIAIMGTSGSGKSTLMNIIGALDKPTSGRYFFEGEDITNTRGNSLVLIRRHKIGFVFQNFNLMPTLTAQRNVEMPLIYSGTSLSERRQRANESLKRVGLGDRLDQKPNKLSGGEQQRVAIARALVNNPKIVLADEPTGNLDSKTSEEIMNLLSNLNKQGSTIVIVTHDNDVAARAKRHIRLYDGRIVD